VQPLQNGFISTGLTSIKVSEPFTRNIHKVFFTNTVGNAKYKETGIAASLESNKMLCSVDYIFCNLP